MKPREKRLPRPTRPSDPASPDILGEHGGVTFRREALAPILREIMPLLEKDWQENGIDREAVPLVFNYPQYLDYNLVGILQVLTARDDGMLVGVIMAYVHPHIDHATTPWALLTWYWLYPEYRGSGIFGAMLEAMETFLRSRGVKVVEASEKIAHAHGRFTGHGYHETDRVYRKLLET